MHLAPAALLLITPLISLFIPHASAASVSRRATVCNGHAELCTKSFGNVTLVGAHDSYAVSNGNIAANQDYDVTTQLNNGIRMLQVQAHNSNGTTHLCHTSCTLLDSGTFTSYLTTVKSWLDSNPNEVIAILIVNIDNQAPTIYSAIYEAAGLDALSFTPSAASLDSTAWPTLGSMIDSGKRVVTFMDSNADFTSVPYIIDEFSNVWETAFDVTDQTFDCNVNRTAPAGNKMYLINHFLDKNQQLLGAVFPVPNKDLLNVTNSASGTGSLGLQTAQCGAQYGKYPTFMLLDFYNWAGNAPFQLAADMNSVSYTDISIASPITSSSSPSSTSTNKPSAGSPVLRPSSGFLGALVIVLASAVVGGGLVL